MKKKETEEKEKLPPDEQMRLDLYDWIQSLMVALVICIALFIFVVRVIDVSGSSMFPTLHNGDKMIVSNLFYKPKYGDVIVFKTDTYDPNKALVKRVIATEGQEISLDFDRGVVYIDGKPLEEDYIAELTKTKLDFSWTLSARRPCRRDTSSLWVTTVTLLRTAARKRSVWSMNG